MSKLLRATALVSSLLALSVVAKAADLGVRPLPPQPPVPYVPPFSWTGFYVGGNIGGAWSQGTVTDSFNNLTFSNGSNGAFIGGGEIGGNYQINNFVAGLEWDFDWAANSNNTSAGIPVAGTVLQVASNNRWITTLAARFGVAANNLAVLWKGRRRLGR
jgi:outer membrane immunogenic protein